MEILCFFSSEARVLMTRCFDILSFWDIVLIDG